MRPGTLLNLTSEVALQTQVRSRPLLPSQRPDRRVIQLQPGCPALLREQGQNPTNDNSAVLASFQVGSCYTDVVSAMQSW